ncbi:hypothetical protein PM082_019113 [Marasmius tenuissimus]|nr:hypothetical protein PM082_019113 [Marasmius tenuissimus]
MVDDVFRDCSKITLEFDEKLCRGWEQDLDAFLVFAGLFSAVVASFVVETYKELSVDSRDRMVDLLAELVAANAGSPVSTPVPFEPEPSAIRVNTFFFLSLVTGLSSALLAILCKQWLREYRRDYPPYFTPTELLAARQSRYEGLIRWRVPGIVTFVPFLLQVAAALFFVGLLYLLWPMNHTVAIFVTVAVVVSLLSFVLTTVLAPLLLLTSWVDGKPTELLSQCPYKTPVGWTIVRTLTIPFLILNRMLPERKQFYSAKTSLSRMMKSTIAVIRTLHWTVYDIKFAEGCMKEELLRKAIIWLYPVTSTQDFASCLDGLQIPTAHKTLTDLMPFLNVYWQVGEWAGVGEEGSGRESKMSLDVVNHFLQLAANDDGEGKSLPKHVKKDIIVLSSLLYRRRTPSRTRIDHCLERCVRIMNSTSGGRSGVGNFVLKPSILSCIYYPPATSA